MPTTKCCEVCKGFDKHKRDWEIAFEDKFVGYNGYVLGNLSPDELKSFIRSLLEKTRVQAMEEAETEGLKTLQELLQRQQSKFKEELGNPVIKEFLEATPIWLKSLSEYKQCAFCGMRPEKIEELCKVLSEILNSLDGVRGKEI